MVAKLNNNFGQAGLTYAQFLGANYDQVAKDVSDTREKLEAKLQLEKDERFWGVSITVIYLGALYANRLGLTDIDLGKLLPFLVDVLRRMRNEVRSKPVDMSNHLAVSNVMQQYLSETQREFSIKELQARLGAGTPFVSTVEYVLEFDLTNPALKAIMD
jgi:hypothetical protein